MNTPSQTETHAPQVHAEPLGAPAGAARHFDLIAIAASAGGVNALGTVLAALPADFPTPIAIVQHRTTALPNYLASVLGRTTKLKVKFAMQAETMHAGTVYVAPPDHHLTVDSHLRVNLVNGHRVRHVLSSANPLFDSAAKALGKRVIGVVLTGYDRDATDGVQAIREHGGIVLAQDRSSSEHFDMPHSAIATGCVNQILPLNRIGPTLLELVRPAQSGQRE